MAVDAADSGPVRESLPSIREHRVPVSMNFYDNLFALAPELRPVPVGHRRPGMRFTTTLATIAYLLDAPYQGPCRSRVKAADFTPMGAALMATLAQGMEDASLEASCGEPGEEALDGVQPRGGGWGEVEGEARVAKRDQPRILEILRPT